METVKGAQGDVGGALRESNTRIGRRGERIFGPSRSEYEALRPKSAVHAAYQLPSWLLPEALAHPVRALCGDGGHTPALGLL